MKLAEDFCVSLFSSTLLEKSWNRDSNASGRIVDRRWIKAEEVPVEGSKPKKSIISWLSVPPLKARMKGITF